MNKTISVIGIGRVGLPLSLAFAKNGFKVYGIDNDRSHINKLKNKEMPFIEKGVEELLKKHVNETFIPTTDSSFISKSRVIIITLGTPVDDHLNPDYSQLDAVLPLIVEHIQKDQLIILRSTVAPGTTELISSQIEKKTEFKAGKDYYIAFCPERIAEGNALQEIKEIPQIIGGINQKSAEEAKKLFLNITEKCFISDAKSVELAKILTNMYRYINFAIANEFAILAMENNRNIYNILELINKDYKRGGVAQPGFTAGPCLYKDGFFLLNNIPFSELISVSWRINENLPLYLIERIKEKISLKDAKVAILGLAFKKNIDDTRNSLSFKLKKAFIREQAEVHLHDPFVEEHNKDLSETIKNTNVVVIAMNHDEYNKITKDFLKQHAAKDCIVCDPWNMANSGRIIYKI